MNHQRWMIALLAGFLAFSLVAVPGCATQEPVVEEVVEEEVEPAFDAQTAMIEAANEYFKNEPVPTIEAADLFNLVQAKDAGYQIVDIRSAEHYALGHIDGSINIPFKTIADDENLAKLDDTKKIVVVCYTGHTASMANMVWNMLGYDALTLKFGMSGWVADNAITGQDIPPKAGAGYATTTDRVEGTGGFDPPELEGEYADAAEAIKMQTKAYFAKDLAPTISVEDVYNLVQKKDTS